MKDRSPLYPCNPSEHRRKLPSHVWAQGCPRSSNVGGKRLTQKRCIKNHVRRAAQLRALPAQACLGTPTAAGIPAISLARHRSAGLLS